MFRPTPTTSGYTVCSVNATPNFGRYEPSLVVFLPLSKTKVLTGGRTTSVVTGTLISVCLPQNKLLTSYATIKWDILGGYLSV